jgi:hypothetical protein
MTDMLSYYVLLAILLFMCSALLIAIHFERREWNGGICRKNGLPWRYFDSCHGGDRGYKAGNETCWISYNVDKSEVRLNEIVVKDEKML